MGSVKDLNKIIERELMNSTLDDGKKLRELLSISFQIYGKICLIHTKLESRSINIELLPDEVIELGNNIKRLEAELKLSQMSETDVDTSIIGDNKVSTMDPIYEDGAKVRDPYTGESITIDSESILSQNK
jgi:hypothetical protein